jgi:hypothetical protein
MMLFFAICAIKILGCLGQMLTMHMRTRLHPIHPHMFILMQNMLKGISGNLALLDRDLFLPVLHALQGHPDAGSIWADMIVVILESMEFKKTCHEPCLYAGFFKGHQVYPCRQVDDMLFAGDLQAVLRKLCLLFATKVKIEVKKNLVSSFNGLEIFQSRDYIKIHVGKYIDKILMGHGWEQSSGNSTRPLKPTQMPKKNWSPMRSPVPRQRQPLWKMRLGSPIAWSSGNYCVPT